jgi:hypothetical protein
MSQKIFLLPGYGANERSFRHIRPFLAGHSMVDIDYRPVLQNMPLLGFSGRKLAKKLISTYNIRREDKLIGHSMGGYLSYHIRQIQGNKICMIASFSDPSRVIHLFDLPYLTPLLAGTGFSKTGLAKKYLQSQVAGKPYAFELMEIADNFSTFSNGDLYKMTLMTLEKDQSEGDACPLRIHSKEDRVVRPPNEPYIEVEGGHFCLNLFPEMVVEAMRPFLEKTEDIV